MLRIIILILALNLTFASFGQSDKPAPCGTQAGKTNWLKTYQLDRTAFRFPLDTMLYVPLTIHIVGKDDSSGYFSTLRLVEALCTLNEDYEPANMRFYLEGDVRYIADSDFYEHETVVDGGLLMLQHNVENTVNVYFVSSPAGNCGYNLPWAGIAMNKGCSNAADHTWAHEMGHHFSLPHPFLGWEGGVSWDNSIAPNFGRPAPTEVVINYTDFKDTLYQDTLILDTILVEKVDRSNCYEAADGFCDTEPDYLAYRWNCNQNSESSVQQLDPDSIAFRSDGTLIMSYANDQCSNRFSAEQIDAMRANLMTEKSNYLFNQIPPAQIDAEDTISIISPLIGSTQNSTLVSFEWAPITNATHYVIQASPFNSFGFKMLEEVVDTTFYEATNILANRNIYWRVKPFSFDSPCQPFSNNFSFYSSLASNTSNLQNQSTLNFAPNPLNRGEVLHIQITNEGHTNAELSIVDLNGRIKITKGITNMSSKLTIEIPTFDLSPGVYLVVFQQSKNTFTRKLIIY